MAVKHSTPADGSFSTEGAAAWDADHTIEAGTITTAELGGDITAAGKALLDDASASAQRTTLGLGTIATQNASSVAITGGTAVFSTLGVGTSPSSAAKLWAADSGATPRTAQIFSNSTHTAIWHYTLGLKQNAADTVVTGSGPGISGEPLASTGSSFYGNAAIKFIRENATANNQDTAISFWTREGANNSTTDSEKVRISAHGRVGIKVTDPQASLHISGTLGAGILIDGASNEASPLKIYGAVRDPQGNKYVTYFNNGINPGLKTNGYVTINGRSNDPITNNIAGETAFMLGVDSDVGTAPAFVMRTVSGPFVRGYKDPTTLVWEVDVNGSPMFTGTATLAGTAVLASSSGTLGLKPNTRLLVGATLPTDDGSTLAQFNGAIKTTGAITIATNNTGLTLTNTLGTQRTVVCVDANNYLQLGTNTTGINGVRIRNSVDLVQFGLTSVQIASSVSVAWSSGSVGGTSDVLLVRDAAGVLAQKDAANAQKLRIYGTTTGAKYTQLEHDGTDSLLSNTSGSIGLKPTARLLVGSTLPTDDGTTLAQFNGAIKAAGMTNSALTNGRVVLSGTGGAQTDGPAPAADGTYNNPTSITITNGIITAIS